MSKTIHDNLIVLEESTHTYTCLANPLAEFVSVTTFIKKFFEPFDAEAIAQNLAEKGRKAKLIQEKINQNQKVPYVEKKLLNDRLNSKYGLIEDPEMIILIWELIAQRGTVIHGYIEDYARSRVLPPALTPEGYPDPFNACMWLDMITNKDPNVEFYAEKRIYSDKYSLAGSIDLLVYSPLNNAWAIIDWKTNDGLTVKSFNGKVGIRKATRLTPSSKLAQYFLQLNIYRIILEEEYGITLNSDKSLIIAQLDDKDPFGVIIHQPTPEYYHVAKQMLLEIPLMKKTYEFYDY
jgi:ATP-dependent exoDNAse (exonuclease V) beta subunit